MTRAPWVLTVLALALASSSALIAGCSGSAGHAASGQPSSTPIEEQGARLFSQHCSSCHATTPGTVIVGPSLAGIAQRAGERVEGLDTRSYLETSIRSPDAYLVDGFANLMPPSLGDSLTQDEVDALIAFLLTLE